MKKIKTAVVGVGYLGKYHAEKYADLPQSEFVAVCDINFERCSEIAHKYQVRAVQDYHELIGKVDAVSIVAPTPLHHQIAKFFLENGIHVLLEKPIATSIAEADDLIATANRKQLVLQIGHLERFNNAMKAIEPVLLQPIFIESLRLAPFKLRGSDVNVVLDLMIHDIDLIQFIVKSPIKEIRANGAPVLSPFIDIANARLEFANGCVANVTASRVNIKTERKLRIFERDCYISLDLDDKQVSIHRKGTQEMFPGIPEIISESITFEKGDALKEEVKAFLSSIIEAKPPVVSGEDGKAALETAIQISQIVKEHLEQQHALTTA